jgi:transposase
MAVTACVDPAVVIDPGMSPLSLDLRRRIIRAWQEEKPSVGELADRFVVETATIKRLTRRFRETGSVDPRL